MAIIANWAFPVSHVPELRGEEAFSVKLFEQKQPVVLRNYIDNVENFAPHSDIWSGITGKVTVISPDNPAVTARAGQSGDNVIVEMTVTEIFERISGLGNHPFILGEGERYYVFGNQSPAKLTDLVRWPIGAMDSDKSMYITAAGVLTKAHYDRHTAFLMHLYGKKHVLLLSPKYFQQLYPIHDTVTGNDRRSLVNLRSPDFKAHPRVVELEAMETVLEPGDMLFIPSNWWHEIEAMEVSISLRSNAENETFFRLEEIFSHLEKCSELISQLPPEQRIFVSERTKAALNQLRREDNT
ncbi:cupin-like domain-containing protein [Cylindrospermum sp. FACHB-282]|uniref:cupin-like domain-containing protein n=1 Tax=Cylindrospermum sp. FACHB-282 TaxID=2692794 RepID=UPI001688BE1E|nr:cupin-like domain-containing protein [Cylindrospermum sp. FACHB-282]MBD2385065.1 cupin-like domain-containing protein [Cylindrospermum sp. FACHB-282]